MIFNVQKSNNDSFGIHSVKVIGSSPLFLDQFSRFRPLKIGGRVCDYDKNEVNISLKSRKIPKFPTFIPNIELFTRFLTILKKNR